MSSQAHQTHLPTELAQAPAFDRETRTWTFTRYADIQAALREPSLRQASNSGDDVDSRSSPGHAKALIAIDQATELLNTPLWRIRLTSEIQLLMDRAGEQASVDLVTDVIGPWIAGFSGQLVGELAKSAAFSAGLGPSGSALSIGLNETLSSFLARAWLALVEHPEQMTLLRADLDGIAAASEELLRYAGIVRCLMRRATEDLTIGGAEIGAGDLIALRLDIANRDGARFDSPLRLDVKRKQSGSLSLGAGSHACPGASIVRLVLSIATPVFVAARPELLQAPPVRWHEGSTTASPRSIPARLMARPEIG